LIEWHKTYPEPPQGYGEYSDGLMLAMPKTTTNLSQWRYDRHKNHARNYYRLALLDSLTKKESLNQAPSDEIDLDYYSIPYGYKFQKDQKVLLVTDRHMGVVRNAVVRVELDELVMIQMLDDDVGHSWWNTDKGKYILVEDWTGVQRNKHLL